MELFLASCFLLLFVRTDCVKEPVSQKLRKDVFADYDPDVIPIFEEGGYVVARFRFVLLKIDNVDVHNGQFIVMAHVAHYWVDERLTWNASAYNGVRVIRVKEEDVWTPDIRMYNSLDATERMVESHVMVRYDGYLLRFYNGRLTASCTYDLKRFPFDKHMCHLVFGCWTHSGNTVNLTIYDNKLLSRGYAPDPGWDLISVTPSRHVNEEFINIAVTIEIERRGTKYSWEYITPAVVLTFLIPVLFLLPSHNSARFALGGAMLVTIVLLMDMLRYILPEELMEKPMIGLYYDMMFILVSLAIVVSAIIAMIASKSSGPTPPHRLLKKVLLDGLGRVFFVTYDRKYGAPTGNELEGAKTDNQTSAVTAAVSEWRLIAKVLDRLFFLIFLAVVVIGSIAILPK